jgi:ribosome-associated protein
MRRPQFSEAQILEILADGEASDDRRVFCDGLNITERTYQSWRAKYRDELAAATGPPSRSQRTRDIKAINRLGLRLVALSALDLDRLDLPEDLRDAVVASRTLKKGALGRQKRLVCKLLRDEGDAAIRAQVELL